MPLQFLNEGTKLVIFHEDDLTFHEWDLINGRETRYWQSGSANLTDFTAAFSPDQRSCLTLAIKGGGSLLTDLATLRTSDPHLDLKIPFCAAYSPDGNLFAAGNSVGLVKVWQTDTWREVTPPLGGFLSSVSSVAFSQDGKRLATGSILKEAVKLWDVESAQELLTLEGEAAKSRSTAFSPDGNVLGSMNTRGVLHLWRAPSWEEIEAAEKATK